MTGRGPKRRHLLDGEGRCPRCNRIYRIEGARVIWGCDCAKGTSSCQKCCRRPKYCVCPNDPPAGYTIVTLLA